MRKLIYGVAINDVNEAMRKKVNGKIEFTCPYYKRWMKMLYRCYSPRSHKDRPTYEECKVCESWLIFSNFKSWMANQDWNGKHLDKDIITKGNKIYSPEHCSFVDKTTNNFVNDNKSLRGKYLIGVHFDVRANRFSSSISNPFTGKKEHLGRFNLELDAHSAWLLRKGELSKMLSLTQSDTRVAKALMERYSYSF